MARNADDVVRPKASGAGVFAASERFSRALLANVADMVTISDRDGRIIYASPAMERVSGYTSDSGMRKGRPFLIPRSSALQHFSLSASHSC